jgi:anti-sigma-K factor RskA
VVGMRAVAFPAAMRMRQSLADLEAAFVEEIEEHRERDERIRLEAEQRTRRRQVTRTHRQGSTRFWILVLTLIATAVVVTIAMFQTLYYVMG